MREFMLLIRNRGDHQENWTDEKHEEFLRACERYINKLTAEQKLISAQPMQRTGKMVSGTAENWHENTYKEGDEVIVGYYHIRANDEAEAIAIAKQNPEFAFGRTARVEVRPIKMKEDTTGFVYPNS